MGRSQRKRWNSERQKKEGEAMLLEEMRERERDRDTWRERESEEGRHLEGSGHTCHIPFI